MTISSLMKYTQTSLFALADSNNSQSVGKTRQNATHVLPERFQSTYLLKARRMLLNVLILRGTTMADGVRDTLTPPGWLDIHKLGCVANTLVKAVIISEAGIIKSRCPETHPRHLSVWELRDRSAALLWLSEHPGWGRR